jgi:hypothetical protein
MDLLKDDTWKIAFAAQTRKLQHVLHIPGVKEALAELENKAARSEHIVKLLNPPKQGKDT